MTKENWEDINWDFDRKPWLKKNWENDNFTYKQAQNWIKAGLTPYDYRFASYLKQNNYQPSDLIETEKLTRLKKEYCQRWLSQEYKSQVKEIIINGSENNQGDLVIIGYPNLRKINIRYFKNDQQLILNNLPNLEELNLSNSNFNQGLSFLSDLVNLKELNLQDSNFYGSLKPLENLGKLRKLDIENTDIDSGLEYLPDSLKELSYSANIRKESKCQTIYNLFANEQGKIETDRGNIKNLSQKLQDYKQKNIEQWRKLNFSKEEVKEWMDTGLKLDEYEFANYLRQKGYQSNSPNVQETIKKESWRDIHLDFNYQLRKDWESKGFNKELTQEWTKVNLKLQDAEPWGNNGFTADQVAELIKIGFKIDEPEQAKNWKDKNFNVRQIVEWISVGFHSNDFNYAQEWRNQDFTYEQTQEWLSIGFKLKDANYAKQWREKGFIIEQTKEWMKLGFSPYELDKLLDKLQKWKDNGFNYEKTREWISAGANLDDHEFVKWLKDVKNYTPEWITNHQENCQKISNRFKEYELCSECQWPKNTKYWCRACHSSGSDEVDNFIEKYQQKATKYEGIVEWIPYEKFTEIKYLDEGGFGKIYKTKWNNKDNSQKPVALKSLSDSADIKEDFLQEIANHKMFASVRIVKCYGISQDPNTGNYLMVMDYIKDGNLRKFLKNSQLSFGEKLAQLWRIADGLKQIHKLGLTHRDFHSGNILNRNDKKGDKNDIHCFITDLGLCKPVSETKEENIYGVMPYVAPEVLLSQPYTRASDVYSFGIVTYEVLSGLPPYYDKAHDANLATAICQGLRPQFQIKIPRLLGDLTKRCWDNDPQNRPTAKELYENLHSWLINKEKNTEFTQQVQEVEKYNQTLPDEAKFPDYEKNMHSGASYHSKLLPTKEITQLLISNQLQTKILELNEQSAEVKKISKEMNTNKNSSQESLVDSLIKALNRLLEKSRELTEELEKITATNPFNEEAKKVLVKVKDLKTKLIELEKKDNASQGLEKLKNQKQKELEELKNIIIIDNKLDEDAQLDLGILLESQKIAIKNNNDKMSIRQLEKSKKELKDFGFAEKEIEKLCQLQKEITELEMKLQQNVNQKTQQLTQMVNNITNTIGIVVSGSNNILTNVSISGNAISYQEDLVNQTKRKLSLETQAKTNQGEVKQTKISEKEQQTEPMKVDFNNWTNLHPNFTPELQKEWIEWGFTSQKTQEWITTSFIKPTDIGYVQWLKNWIWKKPQDIYDYNIEQNLRKKYQEYLVQNPRSVYHPSDYVLMQKWQNLGFATNQCRDWINVGLSVNDYEFASWLKNKNLTPIEVLNNHNYENLKQEFLQSQQFAQIIQTNLPNWQNK